MKCLTCGHETEYAFRFCPNCGAGAGIAPTAESVPVAAAVPQPPVPAPVPAPVVLAQDGSGSRPIAYVRADYDPSRDGRVRLQAAGQPGAPYVAVTAASANSEPRPSTTAQIVLASINIIFVGLGISFILGVIALVFTIIASGETVVSEAWNKLRTAKTLNIIGLVFLAIQLLIIIIMITVGIAMFANAFSQTGPTFGGDYPLG